MCFFFFSSRRRHTRLQGDWSSDVCSSDLSSKLESPLWSSGRASSMPGACRPHFAHVEKTFRIPDWETRTDVAPWCREAAMAINLHGMHWTGYIFNDYAKMLKILEWVATQIPPRNVVVLLPA